MNTRTALDDPSPVLDEVDQLSDAVVSFVRNFGLLQSGQTPCGQPLTVSQAHALAEIEARPGITQRDLARALGLARATVSELVAQLINRGWVNQIASKNDRRQRRLTVTEEGREVTEDIAKARRNLILDVVAGFSAVERTLVVGAAQLLADGAQQQRDKTIDLGR
jgi:DNA-binding MarR family transcriptional regulator